MPGVAGAGVAVGLIDCRPHRCEPRRRHRLGLQLEMAADELAELADRGDLVTRDALGGERAVDLALGGFVQLAIGVSHQVHVVKRARHAASPPSSSSTAAGRMSTRSTSWRCMFFRAWNSRLMIVPLLQSIAVAMSS